jgi:hypothetical protein
LALQDLDLGRIVSIEKSMMLVLLLLIKLSCYIIVTDAYKRDIGMLVQSYPRKVLVIQVERVPAHAEVKLPSTP